MKSTSGLDDMSYFQYSFKSMLDKSIHTLEGIVKGIAIDGKINKSEINELNSWCNDYIEFSNRNPYNELIPLIKEAIADEILTKEESDNILWFAKSNSSGYLRFLSGNRF